MSIYPLPMRFPVPLSGSRTDFIDVTITPDGWHFMRQADESNFHGQPVADRLEYRKCFEAQVALAKTTKAAV